MKVVIGACLFKTALILLVLLLTPWPWTIPVVAFVTWGYQYVVAWFYGVKCMPTMDTLCFMGNDDIRTNVISHTTIERSDFELAKQGIRRFMAEKEKLRWKIVSIWGDYYWKDTQIEESIDYVF
jgi:hypothetical protein